MKQFAERGLDKAGIRLIATGDVTDDDQLNDMGDVALGVVNAHHYSAAHKSAVNKKFVDAFRRPTTACAPELHGRGRLRRHPRDRRRPNTTKGAGGEALLAAMKGQDLREPARPGADRRADARHRARHLHPQGRARRRRALERRVRRASSRRTPASRSEGRSASRDPPAAGPFRLRLPGASDLMLTLFDGIAYGMLLFVLAAGLAVTWA